MPQFFIDEIAHEITQEHEDLSRVLIVIPNRRAANYLNQSIAEQKNQATWLPKIHTLSEWIDQHSDYKILNSTEALFYLYKAYKKVFSDPDTFASFFNWGKMILNDFNEIDRYLLNAVDVFQNLKNIKEIENWSFSEDQLSELQETFHEFWLQLNPLYDTYNEILEEKKLTTSSILFKSLAQDQEQLFKLQEEYQRIYFVGFNALSKAEEQIFNFFIRSGNGLIKMDLDTYYTEDPVHEAGRFYRRIKKKWPENTISQPQSFLEQNPIKITTSGSPTSIGQINKAMQYLQSIPEEEHADTVVVLADEDLIWPTLTALPETLEHVNITMGIALKWTPLQPLINSIFGLQQSHQRMRMKKGYYFKTLLPVLQHPMIMDALPQLKECVHRIEKENRIFISKDWLAPYLNKKLEAVIDPWEDWKKQPIENMSALSEWLYKSYEQNNKENALEQEMLYLFRRHLSKLQDLISVLDEAIDINVFKSLFFQYWQQEKIELYGDPTDQLQIMGMLETRSLNYKNVIVLGLNEGVFPKTKKEYSIIPYDLKHFLGLPSRADRDAVFANHFYRLIQRSENVFVTYGTHAEGVQDNEQSRYLTQLAYELLERNKHPETDFSEFIHTPGTKNSKTQPHKIDKTEGDIESIRNHIEYGVSPSALNTYINCSMDYYYKYVLGLGEEEELEEDISDSSFGSIVHDVLEELYRPFVGKKLEKSDVAQMKSDYPKILESAYLKVFKTEENFAYGMNRISYNVSDTFISNFLDDEINRFNEEYTQGLKIIDIEKTMHYQFELLTTSGKKINAKIKGKIDRIDQVGEQLRVIDYKSGKAEAKDTKFNQEELLQKRDLPKANQLMMYALMAKEQSSKVIAGIFSMRNRREGLIPMTVTGKDNSAEIDEADKVAYEENLKSVLSEMLDLNTPFEHNPDSDFCERCVE